jgi:serine/threonine protein phosphatase PrpC
MLKLGAKRRSIVKGRKSIVREAYHTLTIKSSNPLKSRTNEDRFAIRNFPNFSLFAVFDGHMGDTISQYSATNFLRFLGSYIRSNTPSPQSFANAFRLFDQKILATFPNASDGCTATVVYIDNSKIIAANLGDSHALLIRNGNIEYLTTEHSWENKVERKRIQDAGGKFEDGYYTIGNNMIQPTRGFGDFGFKRKKGPKGQELYTSVPSISESPIVGATTLLITSDGIGPNPHLAIPMGTKDPKTIVELIAKNQKIFGTPPYYPDDLTLIAVDIQTLRKRFKE